MARNQEPVTDAEIDALREKMEEQRGEIREQLAEDIKLANGDTLAERMDKVELDTEETVSVEKMRERLNRIPSAEVVWGIPN